MKEGVMNAGPWRIFTPIPVLPPSKGKEHNRAATFAGKISFP